MLRDGLATDTWICLRYIYCYRPAAAACSMWNCGTSSIVFELRNLPCRDADNKCPLVSAYVFAMGGYQMVFGVSWGHHFLFRPYDLDVSSMISGFLGIVNFSVSSAGLAGLAGLG